MPEPAHLIFLHMAQATLAQLASADEKDEDSWMVLLSPSYSSSLFQDCR